MRPDAAPSASCWPVRRLKYAAAVNPSTRLPSVDGELPVSFVPMEAVGEYGGLDLSLAAMPSGLGSGYTKFRNGDVLVAKITPCFENGKGAIARGLRNGIGFGTTELHVLRPGEGTDSRYLFYLTISIPFRDHGEAAMYGAGGQKRVPTEFVRDSAWPFPPLDEQREIADHLDRKTAAIDSVIRKKRRMIQLLHDRRQAIVRRLVTRGEHPSTPMRDCTADFAARVPAHWRVGKLKYGTRFIGGGTPPKETLEFWGGSIPWVSPKDMKVARITETEDCITPEAVRLSAVRMVPPNAVLVVVRSGILRHTLPVAINAVPVTVNQDMKALLPTAYEPEFLRYLIIGLGDALLMAWRKSGTTVESIEHEMLANCSLPIPPREEQRAIVRHLGVVSRNVDEATRALSIQIDRLREYRQALISAAVTGTLDVRAPEPVLTA